MERGVERREMGLILRCYCGIIAGGALFDHDRPQSGKPVSHFNPRPSELKQEF
jgi:hypothetical protein